MFSLTNTTKESQTPLQDKVLYMGCDSTPVTFSQLDDLVDGAANSLLVALELIEGVRDRKYNDDRAALMGAIVLLKHGLECVSELTPGWKQED